MKQRKNLLSRLVKHVIRSPVRLVKKSLIFSFYMCAGYMGIKSGKFSNHGKSFRSSGVTVSLLLPSRGRVDALCASLKNIAETVGDGYNEVEVLIRLDDDDTPSITSQQLFRDAIGKVPMRIITGPRHGGYKTFYLFVNELSEIAKGDFLLLYNDDARFITRQWQRHIAKWRNRLVVLKFETGEGTFNIFPAVHRKIYQILGHFSLIALCDAWIVYVARSVLLERAVKTVEIQHFRGVEDEVIDETFEETASLYPELHLKLKESKELRDVDSKLLAGHIAMHGVYLNIAESEN